MQLLRQIWVISDFIYFECAQLKTTCFSDHYQTYHVEELEDSTKHNICAYESPVDFNILHVHKGRSNELYVPAKYDLSDLIEQHAKGKNPLHF